MGISLQLRNIRLFFDLVLVIMAFIVGEVLSPPHQIEIFTAEYFILLIIQIFVWVFYAKSSGLYQDFESVKVFSELLILLKNVIIQFVSGIMTLFFIKNIQLSRRFILYYCILLIILLITERYFIRLYLTKVHKTVGNPRRILIIGAGKVGKSVYKMLSSNFYNNYFVIGFLDDQPKPDLGELYLGNLDTLYKVLEKNNANEVIIALPAYATQKIDKVIDTCKIFPVQIRLIPDYFKYLSKRYSLDFLGTFPVINIRNNIINELPFNFMKRLFDIVFAALIVLFILSWLIPIVGLLIKISSPGPIFFIQERWGRNNHKFKVLKFRTMVPESKDVDADGNYCQAKKNDPRITKVGNFLRKTNLDEFPQFINVLKGDMSVVGPRPHPTPLNIASKDKVKYYLARHLVKPGVTGWAQVNGLRGETDSIEKMQKRVEYDLWYIENWSFWLDLQIIFLTVWQMIKGDPNAY